MYCGFDMEGHAGFNTNGPDILCASLSAISQMTVNGVLDWVGLQPEDIVQIQDQTTGRLLVALPDNMNISMTIQQLFKSFFMYVEQLAELYPENVDIEGIEKEENNE